MADGPLPEPSDTSPEAERLRCEYWRRATIDEKLEYMQRLNHASKEQILAELRVQYPDATPRENELRLAARRYPRELMIKAFGWDPLIKGY